MRRPALLAFALAGLMTVAVSAGCGNKASATQPTTTPGSGTGSGTSGAAVTIQNFAFSPPTLTVTKGTTVTWTNKDSTVHTVDSTNGPSVNAAATPLFASDDLSQGQTFSFTFTKAGTYFYDCAIHVSIPSMHAKIVVKP